MRTNTLSPELLELNGDANFQGNEAKDISVLGISDTSANDKFEITYNSTTESLDFTFVG